MAKKDDAAIELDEMITAIKSVVSQKEAKLRLKNLSIAKIRLQVKTKSEGEIGAGGTLTVIPIELDLSKANFSTTTIDVSLVPAPAGAMMLASDADFGQAIDAVVQIAKSAAESPPAFKLDEGTITFEFGVTKKGGFKFIFGGKLSRQTTHLFAMSLKHLNGGA